MDRENSEVKMEMQTRGAEMSEEARTAAVFSCEYSEQNPVYCQQCGGHEHLCRKRLNTEGLTADFAFSLFQWKDVADGLPEATGLFVASIKGRGLTITGFAVDSDLDKWRWEDKYDRYIPYPIPIYEEGAQ